MQILISIWRSMRVARKEVISCRTRNECRLSKSPWTMVIATCLDKEAICGKLARWVALRSMFPRVCFVETDQHLHCRLTSVDIPDAKSLLQEKQRSLARFIHVLKPLRDIYSLPEKSLHIFYNTSGGLIAFNRNSSLFVNLRFFEAWRKSSALCSKYPLTSINR